MFVFSLSSGSAAQMPLAFVLRQYALCLLVQRAVDMIKALGDIFMYGTFRDSEFFGGLAHSSAGFSDISGDVYTSRVSVAFQTEPSPACF